MIHVQIASQLTRDGVDGVRWVLVEPVDTAAAAPPTPAASLSAAMADGPAQRAAERNHWALGLAKAGVLGLGMGAALWAGQAWLGPVTAPLFAADRTPAAAVVPAAPDAPAAGAAAPALPGTGLPAALPAASAPAERLLVHPGERPATASGERPATVSGERPATAPGERPATVSGERPGAAPGERPATPAGGRPAPSAGERPARLPAERPAGPPLRPALPASAPLVTAEL